jgi:hypothetical protein
MAWTLEQIAAYLPQLSSPDEPIRYSMAGTRITAHWDVAHVAYVALLGGGTIDEQYTLTVDLDAQKLEYSFDEHKTTFETQGGIDSGGFSFGMKKTTFRGKMKTYSYRSGVGTHVSGGDTNHTYSYVFEDSRIKQPLFGLLKHAGYAQKRGFFARLFG